MVNLGQMVVNDKRRASEPHPAEGCLCTHRQTSMIWYTWRFSILSEHNYRNLFQLPTLKTFKANTTFSIDHLSSQALAHSHHSIRVGKKVTALFSRNYGFLRVRSTLGQGRLNNKPGNFDWFQASNKTVNSQVGLALGQPKPNLQLLIEVGTRNSTFSWFHHEMVHARTWITYHGKMGPATSSSIWCKALPLRSIMSQSYDCSESNMQCQVASGLSV